MKRREIQVDEIEGRVGEGGGGTPFSLDWGVSLGSRKSYPLPD